MITQNGIVPVGGWNKFDLPRPYVTTSGFAVDDQGAFPILYRGNTVRSARNCWSIPSGLHEIGYTLAEQLAIELKEECNLDADPATAITVATYENIAPELKNSPNAPQWHWVVSMLVIRVVTLDDFINKEHDKHPKYQFIKTVDLMDIAPWGSGLGEAIKSNYANIKAAIDKVAAL